MKYFMKSILNCLPRGLHAYNNGRSMLIVEPSCDSGIGDARLFGAQDTRDLRPGVFKDDSMDSCCILNRMKAKRLYIEQRPQGDYAVREEHSKRASAITPTQAEAIERARELNPGVAPDVERVRHTKCGKPDQWRRA